MEDMGESLCYQSPQVYFVLEPKGKAMLAFGKFLATLIAGMVQSVVAFYLGWRGKGNLYQEENGFCVD